MSRPIARTLGAFALAAALAASSTAAFAATTYGDPAIYVTKKKASTLVGLSRELQTSALQAARSRPNAPRLTGQGGTSQPGMSDSELDMTFGCGGDWFITWDETADGDPILGTFNLHCAGDTIPIG